MTIALMLTLFLSVTIRIGPEQELAGGESERVCVVGKVAKPSDLVFKDGLTVTQAIAEAGGILPGVKDLEVIVLSSSGGKMRVIDVDLKAIQKKRKDDLKLQALDIVEVLSRRPEKNPKPFVNPCPWVPVFQNRL